MAVFTNDHTAEIEQKIKSLFQENLTKQQVFERLSAQYSNSAEIANILRYIPSPERNKKYGNWNTAYLIFLLTLCVLTGLFSQSILGLIWLLALVFIVLLRKFKFYLLNVILGIILALTSIGISIHDFSSISAPNMVQWKALFFGLPIALILIVAGFVLPKKLVPNYTEGRETYLNENGQKRARKTFSFKNDVLKS